MDSKTKDQAVPTGDASGCDSAAIERALKFRAMQEDGAVWPDAYSESEQAAERESMRAILGAANNADGPSAYCRGCQSAGMSNCGHFDECSGGTCITCHRPLNAITAPDAPPDDDWHLRGYAYASKQATDCASCGEHKHTPLRIDEMGGYVCLTCIDNKLGALLGEFGYPAPAAPTPGDVAGCVELLPWPEDYKHHLGERNETVQRYATAYARDNVKAAIAALTAGVRGDAVHPVVWIRSDEMVKASDGAYMCHLRGEKPEGSGWLGLSLSTPQPARADAPAVVDGEPEQLDAALTATPSAQAGEVGGEELLIRINGLEALVDALNRAEAKGYMPDTVMGAWEAFDYEYSPTPQPHCPVCHPPTEESK